MKRHGFTLLETLLALMVFSTAVVALVEAVHQLGEHTLLRRHEAMVQERMRSLLVEHTRMLEKEVKLQEGEVSYIVTHTPLELKDRDGQQVTGLFEVRVIAAWKEGQTQQQASAETWVYPPLFR